MPLSRRVLLIVLALGLFASPRGQAAPDVERRVVLVILGGGVRSRDMLDSERMPRLAAWAKEGVLVERVKSEALDSNQGAARLLTGRADALPEATGRPRFPTLMEEVRGDLELDAHACWFVSFEGEEALDLAHSEAPTHGADLAPSVTHGAGPFGEALADFLETRSRPYPLEEKQAEILQRLRAENVRARGSRLPPAARSLGTRRLSQIERVLLAELDARNLYLRGAAIRDQQALRCAATVLTVHRPVLTVIRLGEAEQAEASATAYFDVLRENDERLAALRAQVDADPEMAATTLWVFVNDRGRNRHPGEDGRLRADQASPDRDEVAVVFSGPGLPRGARVVGKRNALDLAPTLAAFLGARMEDAAGRTWTRLIESR